MESRGWARFAPLTGVVFFVLIVVAIAIGGSTPDNKDSTAKVVKFWNDNDSKQVWGAIIAAWATFFFVWFASSLRSALAAAEQAAGRVSNLSFAGAVMGATGFLVILSFSFAAADTVGDVPPLVTQSLTIASNDVFLPTAVGFALFFVATGVVTVRTGVFPAWLGWLTIVIGIVNVTPAGFFALVVGLFWILAMSIVLFRREGSEAGAPPAAATT